MMGSPLASWVSEETRRRERAVAAAVGMALGLAVAAVAFLLGGAA